MSEPDARPDPDALLARVKAQEVRAARARFKVYLGYAPGVGKTYKMLEAAREQRAQGLDVAVGLVETHGRYDTAALLLGLDVLPRRAIEHRGTRLQEFDLDGALARKPRLLLLDELAHTNAPGARHARRWQDVLELLEAGIPVVTTLNVQHVESLNDVVAQITGVRVRETVPDHLLDRADEIELVDLPIEELHARLREGKVYFPEQASRAAEHFFKRGNLLALRELALRRAADRVDADVRAWREEHAIEAAWPAAERILVCVGPAPASARLLRAASRMAAGLRAPWIAAYVEPIAAAPLAQADARRLDEHLRLAESLGGDVLRLSGASRSEALLDWARKHHVTRILIGKPTHSRLLDRLRGSLLDEVVRGSGDIDVHVISGDDGQPGEARRREPARPAPEPWGAWVWAAGLVVAATAACFAARGVLGHTDVAMVYLLALMVVASTAGRGPSVLAAGLAVAGYDFFFIPPFFTFAVSDPRQLLTFAMMFGVGLVISTLTLRLRRQEQEARARGDRAAALHALSRELGAAVDEGQVAEALARQTAEVFGRGAAVLLPAPGGEPAVAGRRGEVTLDAQELVVARWVLDHGRPAGAVTETLPGARVTCLPLGRGVPAAGVLALAAPEGRLPAGQDPNFLDAFVRQGAIALERAHLAEEAKLATVRAHTEEMRSSLLSAVSHDLRTPLASITGAATALRDSAQELSAGQRADLLQTLCEEAERLERLVGNLLDMTRLESGGLRVRREWVPLEELVGPALARLEERLAGREVLTSWPGDLPLLEVDPVLLEQVFVNLVENAAKYTPPGSPLEIRARREGADTVIEVADRGPGLPAGAEAKVFEKFWRGAHPGVGGVGLGLAICKGVVEAHDGSLAAENREGGGALFRIRLPGSGRPPPVEDAPGARAGGGP